MQIIMHIFNIIKLEKKKLYIIIQCPNPGFKEPKGD